MDRKKSNAKGKMGTRSIRTASLVGTVAIIVATGCRGESEAAPGPGGFAAGGSAAARAIPVETGLVESGTIQRQVTVSGVVEPIRTVAVNSQLAGALLSVEVEEGDLVRGGQPLARIDDRELAAQEESARANHAVAEAAWARAQTLYDRQVITIDEYERDRTAFVAAEAQLDQIRTRRGYATLSAPVAGVILEKRVETGDVVGTQTHLFTIGEISTLVVRVQVSELDVVALSPGDVAEVALDAFPGRTMQGTIRRIFPAADPATRLVPVEVALSSESPARPGFLARVTFGLQGTANAILVPTRAVVNTSSGQTVFVVRDGVAIARTVTVGMTDRGRLQVTSGLEPGETIVVTGANDVRDGAVLRVLDGRVDPAQTADSPLVLPSGGES